MDFVTLAVSLGLMYCCGGACSLLGFWGMLGFVWFPLFAVFAFCLVVFGFNYFVYFVLCVADLARVCLAGVLV